MKACANYLESLALLASEPIDSEGASELRQHIAQCSGCREYFRELSLVCDAHEAAFERVPSVEVAPRLFARVAAAVRDQTRSTGNIRQRFLVPPWLQVPIGVALLLLLACGLVFVFRPLPPRQLASSLVMKPSPKGDVESASFNLNAYRIALNRSADDLDRLLDREAARPGFNSNGSLRLGLTRVDSGF